MLFRRHSTYFKVCPTNQFLLQFLNPCENMPSLKGTHLHPNHTCFFHFIWRRFLTKTSTTSSKQPWKCRTERGNCVFSKRLYALFEPSKLMSQSIVISSSSLLWYVNPSWRWMKSPVNLWWSIRTREQTIGSFCQGLTIVDIHIFWCCLSGPPPDWLAPKTRWALGNPLVTLLHKGMKGT